MSTIEHFRSGALIVSTVFLMLGSAKMGWTQATQPKTSSGLIHSVQGADLFRAYCASCHGPDGAGTGPAASALKIRPPDLTRIAQRNGGVFPEDRVRSTIVGDITPSAHGSREMPVWGPVFHQVEQDQDWGNVRLQNLVTYLRKIQKKSIRKK